MANILPGAVWQPVEVGNRSARRKGRGLVGHVAVSSSKNLAPGPLASRSADWHFYLPKDGPAIQYIDMDLQSWATSAGNSSLVAFESEGGLGTTAQVNAEPWTANQLNWAARILRHLHDTEGVPLQAMPDSRTNSRGFGTHRLGISPWRVADGEVWSSANGKLCPGDAKVAQVPQIIELARAGAGGDDDMTPDEHRMLSETFRLACLNAAVQITPTRGPGEKTPGEQVAELLKPLQATVNALASALTSGRDDITADEIRQVIREEMAKVVNVEVSVKDSPA